MKPATPRPSDKDILDYISKHPHSLDYINIESLGLSVNTGTEAPPVFVGSDFRDAVFYIMNNR